MYLRPLEEMEVEVVNVVDEVVDVDDAIYFDVRYTKYFVLLKQKEILLNNLK